MTLTRQRKAGYGLLAIAVSALAVDRLFLGGGSPAAASAGEGAALLGEAGTTAPRPLPTGPGLASRLESIATAEGLDPVAVEDLFADEVQAEPLILSATLGTGTRAAVTVNNQLVRVGQRVAGAELLEVTRDGARFRRGGEEFFVTLALPRGDLHTPPDR
ncbi:MAG TPA: hypothetical protein VFF69_16340 [Phycisphaerales bacterium]|nr:hypothetical protein [Phycisphaerales bacterium]